MDTKTFSRIIIIVPIVIFVLALITRSPDSPLSKTSKEVSKLTTDLTSPTKQKQVKIDLKGPYHCSYSGEGTSTEVYIKNKRVLAAVKDNKTHYILLNDDCVYSWDIDQLQGSKVCGIKQYVNFYDSMSFLNMFDLQGALSSLMNLKKKSNNFEMLESEIPYFVESCVKESVSDELFTVPDYIKFTETQDPPAF